MAGIWAGGHQGLSGSRPAARRPCILLAHSAPLATSCRRPVPPCLQLDVEVLRVDSKEHVSITLEASA